MFIKTDQNWHVYAGHIFKFPQSTVRGIVHVMTFSESRLTALDQIVERLFVDTLSPAIRIGEPEDSVEGRLVRRILHWVCEVQRKARIALSPHFYIRLLSSPQGQQAGRYEIALPISSFQAFRIAFDFFENIINSLSIELGDKSPLAKNLETRFDSLIESLKSYAVPGFNSLHILDAAYRQGYPVRVDPIGIILIGTGARTRMLHSTATDETSAVGLLMAQDKRITACILRSLGLPAAEHVLVQSEDEAVAAARKFGFPVVIKPANLDQGKGVAANLRTEQNVRGAYAEASKLSSRILLERHFHGFGHRITLYKGELVSALRRIPGGVIGDGVHTIKELLEQRRNDPRTRNKLNYGRVTLDEEAIAMLIECQMTADSVPSNGEFVMMRRRDNISAGGTTEPLQAEDIHPDNLLLARRAALALYLDLAGVDLLIPDISVSWKSSGALICEVNAKPQFGPGADGLNYDRILQSLMRNGARIPVRLFLLPDDSVDHVNEAIAIAHRLGLQAVASCQGLRVDNNEVCTAFSSGHEAALAALNDREIKSVLIVLTAKEVVQSGLPLDRVDAIHVSRNSSWDVKSQKTLQMALYLTGIDPSKIIVERAP